MRSLFWLIGIISFLVFLPWNDSAKEDGFLLQRFQETLKNDSSLIPIVSFNIRLDAEESNVENHYRFRVHRLADFFNRTRPLLVGLQEPFSGQLLHLQRLLPKHYKVIGYERNLDRSDRRRMHDYQTAILYDGEKVELVNHDHYWLSETPRTPDSKSWGSIGSRTVTIGAFKRRNTMSERTIKADFIHINTHLDVWSKPARIEQAKMLLQAVKKWQNLYPDASIFVTGDFNTANGHEPHRILVSNNNILKDVWDECVSSEECLNHDFSSSFHGWIGSHVNKYGARIIHFILQIIHGSGADLPRSVKVPTFEELWKIIMSLNPSKLYEGLGPSLSRIHVDWILVSKDVNVKMAYLGEIRDNLFSSDHFPLLAILNISKPEDPKRREL